MNNLNSFEKYAVRGDLLTRAKQLPTGNDPFFTNKGGTPDNKPGKVSVKPQTLSLEAGYKQWSTGRTPRNMGALMKAARPIIDSSIKTFASHDSPILRTQAKQLAIQAVKRYDPKTGVPLKNWIMQNMRGLRRLSAQRSPLMVPERVRLDAGRIAAVAAEFREAVGREPTMEELADATKLSVKRLSYVRKLDRPLVAEGQLSTTDDGSEGEGPDVYLPGEAEESWMNTWAQFVYHDLPVLDKQIYNMYLGREGYPKNMSVLKMAAKLRISSAAVSQRAKKIAEKLEEGEALKRGQDV